MSERVKLTEAYHALRKPADVSSWRYYKWSYKRRRGYLLVSYMKTKRSIKIDVWSDTKPHITTNRRGASIPAKYYERDLSILVMDFVGKSWKPRGGKS